MTSSLQIESVYVVYFFYNLNSNAIIISNGMVAAALLLKVPLSVFRLLVGLGSLEILLLIKIIIISWKTSVVVDITSRFFCSAFCGEELCDIFECIFIFQLVEARLKLSYL